REIHEIDWLVEAGCRGRPHDDVLRDHAEVEIVVHRGSDEIRTIDRAPLEGLVYVSARKDHRGHARIRENLSDHPAGHTDPLSLELVERTDGNLRVNQVQVVLDWAHIEHVVGLECLPSEL